MSDNKVELVDIPISVQDYYCSSPQKRKSCSSCKAKAYWYVQVGFLSYDFERPKGRYSCGNASCMIKIMKKMQGKKSDERWYVEKHK